MTSEARVRHERERSEVDRPIMTRITRIHVYACTILPLWYSCCRPRAIYLTRDLLHRCLVLASVKTTQDPTNRLDLASSLLLTSFATLLLYTFTSFATLTSLYPYFFYRYRTLQRSHPSNTIHSITVTTFLVTLIPDKHFFLMYCLPFIKHELCSELTYALHQLYFKQSLTAPFKRLYTGFWFLSCLSLTYTYPHRCYHYSNP